MERCVFSSIFLTIQICFRWKYNLKSIFYSFFVKPGKFHDCEQFNWFQTNSFNFVFFFFVRDIPCASEFFPHFECLNSKHFYGFDWKYSIKIRKNVAMTVMFIPEYTNNVVPFDITMLELKLNENTSLFSEWIRVWIGSPNKCLFRAEFITFNYIKMKMLPRMLPNNFN